MNLIVGCSEFASFMNSLSLLRESVQMKKMSSMNLFHKGM